MISAANFCCKLPKSDYSTKEAKPISSECTCSNSTIHVYSFLYLVAATGCIVQYYFDSILSVLVDYLVSGDNLLFSLYFIVLFSLFSLFVF